MPYRKRIVTCPWGPWTMCRMSYWQTCLRQRLYSRGSRLNTLSGSGAFAMITFRLPTPWEVRPCLRRGTRFSKYDIRDGFFSCAGPPRLSKVALCEARTADVGSALAFCVHEFPFDILRHHEGNRRFFKEESRAGRGIHFFVFVDDWLVVGHNDVVTLPVCELLEDELRRRGITWTPHTTSTEVRQRRWSSSGSLCQTQREK